MRFFTGGSLAVLVAGLCLGGPASAGVDAGRLAEANRSAQAFSALAAGSETSGAAPRESDPAVSALLSRILDEGVITAGAPALAEAEAASTLLRNGTRVLTHYMLAGTGMGSLEALAGDAEALSVADANMARYAPEVGRLYDFTVRMQARVATAVALFRAGATPEQAAATEAGLSELRGGILQTFGAILDDAGDDGFDAAWRKQRVVVLGDVGPEIARVLGEDDLTVLRAKASAMAGETADTSMRTELQRLVLVLKGR